MIAGALAVLMAATVAACGGDGISKETFVEGFVTKSGLTREQAVCAADRLFADLSSAELTQVQSTDDWEALSDRQREAITVASNTCLRTTPEQASPPSATSPASPTSTDATSTDGTSDPVGQETDGEGTTTDTGE